MPSRDLVPDRRRVRLAPGWQVWLGGRLRVAGDELDLPADAAEHWTARGWAQPTRGAA
jgi:hypothetical protein